MHLLNTELAETVLLACKLFFSNFEQPYLFRSITELLIWKYFLKIILFLSAGFYFVDLKMTLKSVVFISCVSATKNSDH